jgi:hypothetical protein
MSVDEQDNVVSTPDPQVKSAENKGVPIRQ